MTEINKYRVGHGETIELPSSLTESGVEMSEHDGNWITVVEDTDDTYTTYKRHVGYSSSDPNPPKASNVIVLQLTHGIFDYLEPQ